MEKDDRIKKLALWWNTTHVYTHSQKKAIPSDSKAAYTLGVD